MILHKKLQTRHTFNELHRSSELRATFIHVVVLVHNDPRLLEGCLIHQSTPTRSCYFSVSWAATFIEKAWLTII